MPLPPITPEEYHEFQLSKFANRRQAIASRLDELTYQPQGAQSLDELLGQLQPSQGPPPAQPPFAGAPLPNPEQVAPPPETPGWTFPVQGYAEQVPLHWGQHPGAADLFAPRGTPVVAAQGGKVLDASYNQLGGNSVTIQGDDGLQYYYAHLQDAPLVKAGQTVPTGTALGGVGDSGNAKGTGTHLHFGAGKTILTGTGPAGGAGSDYDAVSALNATLQGGSRPGAAPSAGGPGATQAPGGFSPYDDVFRQHAGRYANDPQFIAIVAAGTNAESPGWDTNNTSGDGGHSWGLFQMHDEGEGKGMGAARLDPNAASAVMVPRYADAYARYTAQGLSGPALAAAVAADAERPKGWDNPNSPARQRYATSYQQITAGGAPTPGAPSRPSTPDYAQLAAQQAAEIQATNPGMVAPSPFTLRTPRPVPVPNPSTNITFPPPTTDPSGQWFDTLGGPPAGPPPLAAVSPPPPASPWDAVGGALQAAPGAIAETARRGLAALPGIGPLTQGIPGAPLSPPPPAPPQAAPGEEIIYPRDTTSSRLGDPREWVQNQMAQYPENPARALIETGAAAATAIPHIASEGLKQVLPSYGGVEEALRYQPTPEQRARTVPLPLVGDVAPLNLIPPEGVGIGAVAETVLDPLNFVGPARLARPFERAAGIASRDALLQAERTAGLGGAKGVEGIAGRAMGSPVAGQMAAGQAMTEASDAALVRAAEQARAAGDQEAELAARRAADQVRQQNRVPQAARREELAQGQEGMIGPQVGLRQGDIVLGPDGANLEVVGPSRAGGAMVREADGTIYEAPLATLRKPEPWELTRSEFPAYLAREGTQAVDELPIARIGGFVKTVDQDGDVLWKRGGTYLSTPDFLARTDEPMLDTLHDAVVEQARIRGEQIPARVAREIPSGPVPMGSGLPLGQGFGREVAQTAYGRTARGAVQGAAAGAAGTQVAATGEGRDATPAELLRGAAIGGIGGGLLGRFGAGRALRAGERLLGSGIPPTTEERAATARRMSEGLTGLGQDVRSTRRAGLAAGEAVPAGSIEALTREVFDRAHAEGRLPTPDELRQVPGFPGYSAKGDGSSLVGQRGVLRPLEDQMAMVHAGTRFRDWYREYGNFFKNDIVPGHDVLNEAATLFAIYSPNRDPLQGLRATVSTMRIVRELDARGELTEENLVRLLKSTNGVNGNNPTQQAKKVYQAYTSGLVVQPAGPKTTAFTLNPIAAARGEWDPQGTSDMWEFRSKGYINQKAAANDPQAYRAVAATNAEIARRLGWSVDQAQAANWMVAKNILNVDGTVKGGGTVQEAIARAVKNGSISDNTVATLENSLKRLGPLLDQMRETVAAHPVVGQSRTMTTSYPGEGTRAMAGRPIGTEASQAAREAVQARSPLLSIGTKAGDLGALDLDRLNDAHRRILAASGYDPETRQFDWLTELGVRHVVEDAHNFGTWTGVEPNVRIRLVGATADQADLVGAIFGLGWNQEAVGVALPNSQADTFGGLRYHEPGRRWSPDELQHLDQVASGHGLGYELGLDQQTIGFHAYELQTPEEINDFLQRVYTAVDEAGLDVGHLNDFTADSHLVYGGADGSGYQELIGQLGEQARPAGRPDLPERAIDQLRSALDTHSYRGGAEPGAAPGATASALPDRALGAALGAGGGLAPPDQGEEDQTPARALAGAAAGALLGPGALRRAKPFYSQLQRTIEEKMPARARAAQITGLLRGSSVRSDEIRWTGLDEFLARAGDRPVTKQEILDHLQQNEVQVQEITHHGPTTGAPRFSREDLEVRTVQDDPYTGQRSVQVVDKGTGAVIGQRSGTRAGDDEILEPYLAPVTVSGNLRYGQYTLPQGQNYQELLLTLPQLPNSQPLTLSEFVKERSGMRYLTFSPAEQASWKRTYEEALAKGELPPRVDYQSAHWDEPNVLAHVRFNDRTDVNGKKTLFLEEIQSDWHQEGRQSGYQDPDPAYAGQFSRNVPPEAPFQKTWHELAFRRMTRWAAEHGYDQIAWTTGAQQAERYDLGHQVSRIGYQRWDESGLPGVTADRVDLTLHPRTRNGEVHNVSVRRDELPGMIGADAARRILDGPAEGTLTGLDLQVGGQGMSGFYDKILPGFANKYGKKWGTGVHTTTLDTTPDLGMRGSDIRIVREGEVWQAIDVQAPHDPPLAEFDTLDEVKEWAKQFQRTETVHSMPITEEMRRSVLEEGQPLFQAVGGLEGAAASQAGTDDDTPLSERLTRAGAGLAAGVAGGKFARTRVGQTAARTAARALPEREGFAGNINLSKFSEPVQEVIQSAHAADPAAFETARRGVLGDQVVADLAKYSGFDAAAFAKRWTPGKALPAEQALALRNGLAYQGEQVQTARQAFRDAQAEIARTGQGSSTTELAALAEEIAKHRELQTAVTGVTAEAGRALRVFRQRPEAYGSPESRLQAILKTMSKNGKAEDFAKFIGEVDLDDPVALAHAVQTLYQPHLTDLASWYWYNSLLSSPVGRIRDFLSTGLATALYPVERAAAAPFDVLASRFTGKRTAYAGELPAEYQGMRAALGEGLTDALGVLKHGFTPQAAREDIEVGAHEAVQGPLNGAILNAPSRLVQANDALYGAMNRKAVLYGDAYRIARQEGLSGQAAAERVAELRVNPTDDMVKHAMEAGKERIWQQSNAVTQAVGGLKRIPVAGGAILPFHKTPINLMQYALERSPIGYTMLTGKALRGKLTQQQFSEGMARATMGTALFGGVVSLASQGLVTGNVPEDAAERDAFYRAGKQPYSIKIGDSWHSYQLAPFAPVMGAAATIADAQQRGDIEGAGAAASTMAMAMAKSVTDLPFMQGLAGTIEALDRPERFAPAWLENQARSLVPQVIQSAARATDEMIRDPNGPLEAIQSVIPGASQGIAGRQTAFGMPSRRPEGQRGIGVLNPFRSSPEATNLVERELARLHLPSEGYRVQPGTVYRDLTVGKESIRLTPEEQRTFQGAAGKLAFGQLYLAMESDAWKSATAEEQRAYIHQVYGAAREQAKAQILPQLQQRATEQRARRTERAG